jgi:hypothetical protein
VRRLAVGLGILALLSPLGLYLPRALQAGPAWGEWGSDEIRREVARETGGPGYVPAGIRRAEQRGWKALLPDYALPHQEPASLRTQSASYLLSGAIGIAGLVLLTFATRRAWARKDNGGTPELDAHPGQT